jgi:Tfp pilus assembly protein PilF
MKFKRLIPAMFTALTAALLPWGGFASQALAQAPTSTSQNNLNSIYGTVTDQSNQPLNNIRVELLNEVEMFVTQAYTTSAGRYTFRNLSQGTFIVRAHSDGAYASSSVRVVIYALRNNGGSHQEQVDIVLKRRDEARRANIPNNSGPAFAQEVPEKARKAYERAVKLLDQDKQYDQGMEALKEALAIFPGYFLAMERCGIELVKREQYAPARTILTRAVEINTSGAASLYVLGVANYHLQQWAESADVLRRSLTLAPDSPNAAFARFYFGLALLKTGKPDDAEPHLKKAYEIGGTSIPADVHMHLAQYYSNQKRYRESADELELFLKQTPDARDAEAIRNLIKQLRAKAKS